MKIDSIKLKSARNPNIFLVVADDNEYIFHSDVIVKYAFATGAEVDNTKFFEALDESDYTICLNKSMEYISSKLKTTKQLKDYLYQKGYKTHTINRVIDKLNEYSVLNDQNFAIAYIEANKEKLSKKAIKNKLQEKGVKKELIDNFLEDVEDCDVCQKMADKFLKNKEISKPTIDKLVRHLQYKGFGWEDISKVLQKLRYEE